MANPFQRLRETLERLVFAGLKPGAPGAAKKSRMESLLESAEDLAALGMQPEQKPLPGPMTLRKKFGIAAGILLVGGFVFGLVTILSHPAPQLESQAPPPPPVEIVPKGLKLQKNKDLEVVEYEFDKNKNPKEIAGTLRNQTDQTFVRCEISFEVTTREGGQLGGVSTVVRNLAPHGLVKFRITVPQPDAGFVMVRELRTD